MKKQIRVKGARQHNLKNLSIDFPKQEITALVGVSGSGKSSLAFDTLYAEGQRRYLEYLSPQARSWIKQMPKPDVDLIEGLSPTLAIGQGKQALHARGTVATYTDIYDFLMVLFANVGEQHSPATGLKLTRYTRQEIIDLVVREYATGTRIQLLAPIKLQKEKPEEAIQRLQQMGFIRLRINNEEWTAEGNLPLPKEIVSIDAVVDRIEMKEGIRERLGNSVETAMDLSQGILKIIEGKEGPIRFLTEIYVCPESGHSFAPLKAADFNFNSPHGACPVCSGQKGQPKIDQSLINWEEDIPVAEQIRQLLDYLPRKISEPLKVVWNAFSSKNKITEDIKITDVQKKVWKQILEGSDDEFALTYFVDENPHHIKTKWKGLLPLLEGTLQDKKIKNSLANLPFVYWQTCPSCKGAGLKAESLSCLIHGKNIHELCSLSVTNVLDIMDKWKFEGKQSLIVNEILPQIKSRLKFLKKVGLGYLELNRQGQTLSDGEAQRIQLASQIGTKLSGILYILDEPSLGLHRQDIQHLHHVIKDLKDLGNTVLLVEHEPSLIKHADTITEIGPGAGIHGGKIVFQGSFNELIKNPDSLTGQWLSGRKHFPKPPKRKIQKEELKVRHATLHNLNNLEVNIPLHSLVVFCGVSGSGKSTLVRDVIGVEVEKNLQSGIISPTVSMNPSIERLVMSHKKTESFSVRSMPATYIDLMTPLRQLFSETKLSKARGYTASRFSLNKKGGRCEVCEGLGYTKVNMQLMPDIFIPCEVCQGLRYNYETLQITWEDYNISQILNLSAEEAYEIFKYNPAMAHKLELMKDLGLEYLTLGQPFNTLSAGEIQRLRLVADLATKSLAKTLYILDEPSAGLHFQDVEKLLKILHRLVDNGHSVFVVEHHLGIIRQADWLIELGPGGGPEGGQVIFEGKPDKMMKTDTPTAQVLR